MDDGGEESLGYARNASIFYSGGKQIPVYNARERGNRVYMERTGGPLSEKAEK